MLAQDIDDMAKLLQPCVAPLNREYIVDDIEDAYNEYDIEYLLGVVPNRPLMPFLLRVQDARTTM